MTQGMENMDRTRVLRALGWQGTSLHFRLTMGMLCMLVFIMAAGLFGLLSVDSVVDRLQRVHLAPHADRAAAIQSDRALDDLDAAYIRAAAVFLLGLGTVALVSIVLS